LFDEKDLPIVLVHGTMGKSEDWSRVVEELSNSRSVIRPDYIDRAAGMNSNELAIRDLADEVIAAVRAEGKQRFDLVGGSLGAAVATCIAAEHPEMVRSLVLVSGFSHGSDPRMNLQFKLWLRNRKQVSSLEGENNARPHDSDCQQYRTFVGVL
jgi:3-oxoadipate enol-lactonase